MPESFERIEKKYLLDNNEIKSLISLIKSYTTPSVHGEYQIMSVYYDNDNFQMITKSIEKPVYKEKLRIRAYSPPLDEDKVFVEIKKKLNGVVYKRRTKAKYKDILLGVSDCVFDDEQVGKEIKYLNSYYDGLNPKVYITCNRQCYENGDLRITFDTDMKYRFKNISLSDNKEDKSLGDYGVMEIKVNGAMPLWLSKILDEEKIYPMSHSKVGLAYLKEKKINGII